MQTHAIRPPLTRELRTLDDDPTERTTTQRLLEPLSMRKHQARPHQHRFTRRNTQSEGQKPSRDKKTIFFFFFFWFQKQTILHYPQPTATNLLMHQVSTSRSMLVLPHFFRDVVMWKIMNNLSIDGQVKTFEKLCEGK